MSAATEESGEVGVGVGTESERVGRRPDFLSYRPSYHRWADMKGQMTVVGYGGGSTDVTTTVAAVADNAAGAGAAVCVSIPFLLVGGIPGLADSHN